MKLVGPPWLFLDLETTPMGEAEKVAKDWAAVSHHERVEGLHWYLHGVRGADIAWRLVWALNRPADPCY